MKMGLVGLKNLLNNLNEDLLGMIAIYLGPRLFIKLSKINYFEINYYEKEQSNVFKIIYKEFISSNDKHTKFYDNPKNVFEYKNVLLKICNEIKNLSINGITKYACINNFDMMNTKSNYWLTQKNIDKKDFEQGCCRGHEGPIGESGSRSLNINHYNKYKYEKKFTKHTNNNHKNRQMR